MGTPAFPNLGKHCSVDDCRQIDFLPFTCDSCNLVFCLEHRSYSRHRCPKANQNDVTVAICPLCAKGVRLIPHEDPNITWESHVNTECDPSNYDKVTKKKKCPVPRCHELLTFSNTVRCKDCTVEHCLKHRFGPDHKCPGPRKTEAPSLITSFLNRSRKEDVKQGSPTSYTSWASNLFKAAEAGITKVTSDVNQALQRQTSSSSSSNSSSSSSYSRNGSTTNKVEQCPQCKLRFSSVTDLVNHVEKVHEKNGLIKVTVDVCPICSKGFRDPVALVEHVEKVHGGRSKA